jgi:hypothetical protein
MVSRAQEPYVRVPFQTVFHVSANGLISPRTMVRLGSLTFGKGITFRRDALVWFVGRDLDIERNPDGSVTVAAYYEAGPRDGKPIMRSISCDWPSPQ